MCRSINDLNAHGNICSPPFLQWQKSEELSEGETLLISLQITYFRRLQSARYSSSRTALNIILKGFEPKGTELNPSFVGIPV